MRYQVALLIGALGAASYARALPPAPGPQIELFLSGATAQDEGLENLLKLTRGLPGAPNVCEPGSLDIYRGAIAGTAKRVFYCRTSANIPGVAPGMRLAVHKSSGGSGEGVTPVSAATPIAYIDLGKLPSAPSCSTPRVEPARGDFATYNDHSGCDGGGKKAVPRAGLSDVDPSLVGGVTGPLSVHGQYQVVWGLPVTKNLRNALQAAQGLVRSSVPHDDPMRDSEPVMPSLTRAQVAGIFAGAIRSWDQFYDAQGKPLSRSATLAPAPPGNPDASGASPGAYRPDPQLGSTLYICRRIASSGTQAAYEIHYLRARCVAGASDFVRPNDGSDLEAGGDPKKLVRVARPRGNVFAGIGSGDVRECLDAHEQFNRWAVGLLSTENLANNGNREFRYAKVDGVAPTLLNAHLGRWSHVTDQSIQWQRSFDASLESTDEGRVLRFVATNMGQPRVLHALNSGFVHPWGNGGYLAPAKGGFAPPKPPVTADSIAASPVAGLARSLQQLNNCAEPFIVGDSGL